MKSHRIVLGLLFIFLSLVVSTGVQATAPISDETPAAALMWVLALQTCSRS